MVTTFYFIRHGQIDGNVERRWYGSTDQELNEEGARQADLLAAYFRKNTIGFDHLYCSPLKRTRVTAEKVGRPMGLEPVNHPDLVEFAIGVLETAAYEDLVEKHRFFESMERDRTFKPEGGESVQQVAQRMVDALREIEERHRGKVIGIVGHGAAFGVTLSQLIKKDPYPFFPYHMDNTAVSKLVWSDAKVELEFFNNSEHLS